MHSRVRPSTPLRDSCHLMMESKYSSVGEKYPKAGCWVRSMIASVMVGTVGKFMSATHMGMASKPSAGGSGAKPVPRPSTARASLP